MPNNGDDRTNVDFYFVIIFICALSPDAKLPPYPSAQHSNAFEYATLFLLFIITVSY